MSYFADWAKEKKALETAAKKSKQQTASRTSVATPQAAPAATSAAVVKPKTAAVVKPKTAAVVEPKTAAVVEPKAAATAVLPIATTPPLNDWDIDRPLMPDNELVPLFEVLVQEYSHGDKPKFYDQIQVSGQPKVAPAITKTVPKVPMVFSDLSNDPDLNGVPFDYGIFTLEGRVFQFKTILHRKGVRLYFTEDYDATGTVWERSIFERDVPLEFPMTITHMNSPVVLKRYLNSSEDFDLRFGTRVHRDEVETVGMEYVFKPFPFLGMRRNRSIEEGFGAFEDYQKIYRIEPDQEDWEKQIGSKLKEVDAIIDQVFYVMEETPGATPEEKPVKKRRSVIYPETREFVADILMCLYIWLEKGCLRSVKKPGLDLTRRAPAVSVNVKVLTDMVLNGILGSVPLKPEHAMDGVWSHYGIERGSENEIDMLHGYTRFGWSAFNKHPPGVHRYIYGKRAEILMNELLDENVTPENLQTTINGRQAVRMAEAIRETAHDVLKQLIVKVFHTNGFEKVTFKTKTFELVHYFAMWKRLQRKDHVHTGSDVGRSPHWTIPMEILENLPKVSMGVMKEVDEEDVELVQPFVPLTGTSTSVLNEVQRLFRELERKMQAGQIATYRPYYNAMGPYKNSFEMYVVLHYLMTLDEENTGIMNLLKDRQRHYHQMKSIEEFHYMIRRAAIYDGVVAPDAFKTYLGTIYTIPA